MKTFLYSIFATGAAVLVISNSAFAAPPAAPHTPDISFQNEVRHAIDKGLGWLEAGQNTNGYWSTADQPAVTALALTAFMGEPSGTNKSNPSPVVRRGYEFITNQVKPDGSIYAKGLENYNTSICMMSLVATGDPRFEQMLRRGREWIISHQVNNYSNAAYNGGVGYGDHGPYSDMNNTMTALEALYYTKYLKPEKTRIEPDLNWAAAIHFIQSCQNLPASNNASWVSTDARDQGGFVYMPGNTKAASFTNAQGRVALRSYGSISYAGMLSYIYADLSPDDPRVKAAFEWLQRNYTIDENPGMGAQGLYYYLHLMTKALTISGVDQLTTASGAVDWRKEVAMKLINLQKADGSWVNTNGRWWERDPALVTSYSLMSLELLYPSL